MRRLRLGSSLRQASKTSSGAGQSRPMTNSLGGREATRLLDGSLLDQRNGNSEDRLIAKCGGERAAVGRAAEGVEVRALHDQPHALPTGDVGRRQRLPLITLRRVLQRRAAAKKIHKLAGAGQGEQLARLG